MNVDGRGAAGAAGARACVGRPPRAHWSSRGRAVGAPARGPRSVRSARGTPRAPSRCQVEQSAQRAQSAAAQSRLQMPAPQRGQVWARSSIWRLRLRCVPCVPRFEPAGAHPKNCRPRVESTEGQLPKTQSLCRQLRQAKGEPKANEPTGRGGLRRHAAPCATLEPPLRTPQLPITAQQRTPAQHTCHHHRATHNRPEHLLLRKSTRTTAAPSTLNRRRLDPMRAPSQRRVPTRSQEERSHDCLRVTSAYAWLRPRVRVESKIIIFIIIHKTGPKQ